MYTKTNFEEYVIGESYKIVVTDTIYEDENYTLIGIYIDKKIEITYECILFDIVLSSNTDVIPISDKYIIDEEFRTMDNTGCNTTITKL